MMHRLQEDIHWNHVSLALANRFTCLLRLTNRPYKSRAFSAGCHSRQPRNTRMQSLLIALHRYLPQQTAKFCSWSSRSYAPRLIGDER
jgi:hypothetical protein